jgi:hypothetical protein
VRALKGLPPRAFAACGGEEEESAAGEASGGVAAAALPAAAAPREEWSYTASLERVNTRQRELARQHGSPQARSPSKEAALRFAARRAARRGAGGTVADVDGEHDTGRGAARGGAARLGGALASTRDVVERFHFGGRSERTKALERADAVVAELTARRLAAETIRANAAVGASTAAAAAQRGALSGDSLVRLVRRNHHQVAVLHQLSPAAAAPAGRAGRDAHSLAAFYEAQRGAEDSATRAS